MIYSHAHFPVPPEKMIRVILDTDAKNEADDQYAIVQALLSPRFDNRAIIAAHFGTMKSDTSMLDSYHELERLFSLMGMDDSIICKGAEKALSSPDEPICSEGAMRIIEEAMSDDPRPLYVAFLGPLTDLASAYMMKPEIAKRMTVIWIGGGNYPAGGYEYNLNNDLIAANVVMASDLEIWQVPEHTYQQIMVSLSELEVRVKPQGPIGEYLFDQLVTWGQTYFGKRSPLRTGECWYLGDTPVIALLLNPHPNDYITVKAPHIEDDYSYSPADYDHDIRVYERIDARFVLEDLYAKLALFARENERRSDDK